MKKPLSLLCLMFLSSTAHAGYSISAGFGKNFTNSVQTEENLKIELENDSHFTVSLDRTIDNARYGFFYSATELDMKDQHDGEEGHDDKGRDEEGHYESWLK